MTASSPNPSSTSGGGIFFFCGLLIVAIGLGLVLTNPSEHQPGANETKPPPATIPDSVKPVHSSNTPGLHNVFRLGETLYSGSSLDDEAALGSLKRLGIRTVISVDGMEPDAEVVRAHGLKCVHLPISYASVPHETVVDLVRTTREFPGPYYVYCHHGKNRGPAAAVTLWRCLDKHVTNNQAAAVLTAMGTADRYQGLYDSVRNASCPSEEELKARLTNLSAASPVTPLVKSMALIDRMWDRVAVPVKDRNSTTISNQLNTAYDIAEQFRELASLPGGRDEIRPGLQAIVDDLEKLAEIIKSELRTPTVPAADRANAVAAINRRCDECHAKFRD